MAAGAGPLDTFSAAPLVTSIFAGSRDWWARWAKRPAASTRARGRVPGLRYLLLAAGGYVILNFTALSLAAAFFGLFVPVAAVILEILFELVYAGT